ncbi:MAG: hypothetical protein ACYSTT_10660 [Planctomycetota bacterium]
MSNFLILVNIVPFPADKVLCGKRAEREPASGAEEHSPVMFSQSSIAYFAAAPIDAASRLRYERIFIIPRDSNNSRKFKIITHEKGRVLIN